MEGKNHNETKKKIKECKKRLNNLKLQGFTFSKRIYDDINELERKVKQPTRVNQLWDKKLSLTTAIIVIFSSIIFLNTLFPFIPGFTVDYIEEEPMKLTIDNLVNGTIISKSVNITGKAEKPNGIISSVKVKIDNQEWEKVKGIEEWNYYLNVTELTEGKHTLFLQCSDGKEFATVNITFILELKKPTVIIKNPSEGKTVSGIVQINGTASAAYGEINRVELSFDGKYWINVSGKNEWKKNFDTTKIQNGETIFFVRVFDTKSHSEEIQRSFIIKNNPTIMIPDIKDKNKFQLLLFDCNEIMIPENTYFSDGFHRHRQIEIFSQKDIYITLKVTEKPDWLKISLPNQPLITPPNYILYNFSIGLSITKEAPRDIQTYFTITATYGSRLAIENEINFLLKQIPFDVGISTGQW